MSRSTKALDRDIRSATESEIAERSWVAILTWQLYQRDSTVLAAWSVHAGW